jgi:tetratricopeptide (TPR) repeat protein
MELIRVLLEHREQSWATSELLILEAELPTSSSSRVETANLFVEAGDLQHAFKDYVEAVRLDGHNREALKGAGETSFELGEYTKSVHYSKALLEFGPESRDARQRLSLAEAILAEDPLAPHLTAKERQSRLLLDLRRSHQRLKSCLNHTTDAQHRTELQGLQAEALALEPQLSGRHAPDSEQALSALGLVVSMQKEALASCGQADVFNEALLLIGRKHGGERP